MSLGVEEARLQVSVPGREVPGTQLARLCEKALLRTPRLRVQLALD